MNRRLRLLLATFSVMILLVGQSVDRAVVAYPEYGGEVQSTITTLNSEYNAQHGTISAAPASYPVTYRLTAGVRVPVHSQHIYPDEVPNNVWDQPFRVELVAADPRTNRPSRYSSSVDFEVALCFSIAVALVAFLST